MASPSLFDGVIFDLDGTLVDTLGDFEAALNRMLRGMARAPITRAEIEPLVGKGSEHLVAEVLKRQPPTGEPTHTMGPGYVQMAALTAYQRHYRAINGQHAQPYEGAGALLHKLHADGVALACVTNKPLAFARDLLERKNMLAPFAHVFGGDSFARKKPDPLPLLNACEALGSAPARTLMVGDSSNDVAAARAAGLPVVLMAYGYNHGADPQTAGADAVLADMAALSQWWTAAAGAL